MKNRTAALALIVGVVLHASNASAFQSKAPLPGGIDGKVRLGMSAVEFARVIRVAPERCASCTDGGKVATVPKDVANDAVEELASFGLNPSGEYSVECYFVRGTLTSITFLRLTGKEAEERMTRKFGKGQILQDTTRISEIEWIRSGYGLRLSRLDNDYSVIFSRVGK
jgi:hypothetical protein